MDIVKIGQRIRKRRQRIGWSVEALAHQAGVTARTVNNVERAAHTPDTETLSRIARALDVGLGALIA